MKRFYSIIIFHILTCRAIEGAEYVEAPFQKYGVMLSQKTPRNFSAEMFPMIMFGEKFLCELPSEKEILFARNIIYPDISVLTERVNAMPCLLFKKSQLSYFVCTHIIYQIHNRNLTYGILGIRYTDNYQNKNLDGFWGKGEQAVFTRHFIGRKICGTSKEDAQTTVWYICRQSKEENVVFLQLTSSCRYEIRILTPRVCSGFNFESETGHELHCYAEKDAMALVLANEDRIESPRYSLSHDFLDSPKGLGLDLFFFMNAYMSLNQESSHQEGSKLHVEEICEKKHAYRAEEIMSTSMGVPFNFSVDPQDESGYVELIWRAMSFLYPERFYKRGAFNLYPLNSITEKVKKMIHVLKKDKKKRNKPKSRIDV